MLLAGKWLHQKVKNQYYIYEPYQSSQGKTAMQKFISYDGLPLKSGGAHGVSKYTARHIYEMLQGFSERLTDKASPKHVYLEFNSFLSGERISWGFLWETIKAFGLPSWSLSQYLSSNTSVWVWKISKRQIDKAVTFQEQFPKLTLAALWHFNFIDPVTKRVLPGQDTIPIVDERLYNSQIYMRCGLKNSVSAWFTLPFDELDSNAAGYIRLMQTLLPFNFSDKHWKLWTINSGRLSSRKLNIGAMLQ